MKVLSYSDLVHDYNDSLNKNLRGFRPAADFLEMWVPDANNYKSLLNMFEAAEMAGVDEFSLLLDKNTSKDFKPEQLTEMVSSLAHLTFVDTDGGLQINVNVSSNGDKPKVTKKDYRSPYRLALGEIASTSAPRFEGTLTNNSQLVFSSEGAGVTLSVAVDPLSFQVLQARHKGAVSPENKALYDLVCEAIEGLPVQEASDHAMIRVEYSLRDQKKPEVQGILTPTNADPIFHEPLARLREIYDSFKAKTGFKEPVNFFDRKPSDEWVKLTDQEKVMRLQAFIDSRTESPLKGDLQVSRVDLEGCFRVFLNWSCEAPSGEKGAYLMKLEREMRDQVEGRLEIFLEEWKDKNSKRRL